MDARERVRVCLRCNQEFDSKGPHNRVCAGCAKANSHVREGGKATTLRRNGSRGIQDSKEGA
jgi:Zn finger protein HypA/HybF involved in hydrogenase expression